MARLAAGAGHLEIIRGASLDQGGAASAAEGPRRASGRTRRLAAAAELSTLGSGGERPVAERGPGDAGGVGLGPDVAVPLSTYSSRKMAGTGHDLRDMPYARRNRRRIMNVVAPDPGCCARDMRRRCRGPEIFLPRALIGAMPALCPHAVSTEGQRHSSDCQAELAVTCFICPRPGS